MKFVINTTIAQHKSAAEIPRVLFLNGPPNCGKAAFTARFINEYSGMRASLADWGKELTCQFFKTPMHRQAYESVKDVPSEVFGGMTFREATIWMMEKVVKAKFGKLIFAEKWLYDYHYNYTLARLVNPAKLIVFDGVGFRDECERIAEYFGVSNCRLLVLQSDDSTFENDSRKYVLLPKVRSFLYKTALNRLERDVRKVTRRLPEFWLEAEEKKISAAA